MTHDVRFLDPDELRAAHTLFAASIHREPASDERWTRAATTYSPGRTLGVHDDGRLIGTATSFPTRTAVVGGAALPTAAVTRVGVRADHTRRGVLTGMMRALLDDVAERGEALASLRASEARIYGRFGYGLATRGRTVSVRRYGGAGWRTGAPRGGSVRMLDRHEIVDVLAPLHEKLALRRTGGIMRPETWWWGPVQRRVDDREHLVAAVHTGPEGDDDAYFLAFPGPPSDPFTERTLRIEDLHAADGTATAELWRFALDLDLVGAVEGWLRPLDEPLELLLADPRDCRVTGVEDETWLRLVDVPTALAARSYRPAGPVLLAVHDPFLERNAGVYRIADGAAERVGPLGGPVAPELECDAAALAMAYLGDRTPSQLAATGWWRVHDGAAVARADAAFATPDTPWCGTYF
ncbi:GNAT family N-acetyltransferase [Pseudonocardia nigra]|uniref:GNAT family N-acetyltransferase n=1 Tax=Pseudonocardia nigra TaxID=1921578 RepID=UPI001C5F7D1F|nr:GNAT family N-acetyltransferase [Pseudonocardia nigra]